MHNIPQPENDLKRIQGKFSPRHILAITIGGIAIAEVIAMIVVYYFKFLPYYLQIFLDAAIMVAIIFPLLYFLSFKPLLLYIQERQLAESISQTRLRLMQFANTHTLEELLQVTLDEIETLTGSAISFFHFVEGNQKKFWLQAWSTNTLQNMCKADGKNSHCDVEQAGVWADCVRHRQPIIHNNYASLPHRKGMPEGHATILREMAVPIMRAEKIVAVLGLGNKPKDFTARDVEIVSTIADFAWDIVEHKQAENALQKSEEKFRTLVNWTFNWEKWTDAQGNIVYMSPSCERITGYNPEEFVSDPNLLIRIVHPDDRQSYEEHHRLTHNELAEVMNIEYRIIAHDGSEHWIEHICRPLFGQEGQYLGHRVSNSDITDRKQTEKFICEQGQKERILTQTIHTMQIDIARDLHDTLGQNISYLRLKLDHLSESNQQPTDLQMELRNMSKAANESYDLIRGTLAVLQLENPNNLLHLFTQYADQIEERSNIIVVFITRGEPKLLSANQIRQLFYVFREALSNIEKYAHASQVTISMLWDDSVLLLGIIDNGRGVDLTGAQENGHYGIKFMQDRIALLNGSFSIDSAIDGGTKITVKVPYET
jgi:PAS domain S-box-containing protein